jgi:PAS domain S-box-containing protein
MLIPAIIIDHRGTIQAFNGAAQKAFDYTTGEMIGKNVSTLMFDEQKEKHDGYLKNYMETGESKIIGVGRKVVVRKKDGSASPCKLFVTKKTDGTATFFTGVLQEYEQ